MGRAAKARAKQQRLTQKRARKASQQALYDARKLAGKNKKSKRFLKGARGSNILRVQRETKLVPVVVMGKNVLALRTVHGGDDCGNVGCKRCSDMWINFAARLAA